MSRPQFVYTGKKKDKAVITFMDICAKLIVHELYFSVFNVDVLSDKKTEKITIVCEASKECDKLKSVVGKGYSELKLDYYDKFDKGKKPSKTFECVASFNEYFEDKDTCEFNLSLSGDPVTIS